VVPVLRRDERQADTLALRWGGEQVEGARQALKAARTALQKLKAVEKKRQQKVRSSDATLWTLPSADRLQISHLVYVRTVATCA
jgi:hypothetical protein